MSDAIWIWIDGAVVPADEARVPVLDRGFLYGDSVFEVTRTAAKQPLFFAEHLTRLGRSAASRRPSVICASSSRAARVRLNWIRPPPTRRA